LIESRTLFQAKVAAQQLEGALSRRLQPIKKKLVGLIAVIEAGIDFAEDDVSVAPAEQILGQLREIRNPLEALRASFSWGRLVHEGFTLAIVGRPNVGKSSLFNRLVEKERAIVTATPGTTRDLVTETVAMGGIPVKLVDTAGIRHADDEAESIGIRKSWEALSDADLVLVVIDSSEGLAREDLELLTALKNRSILVAANKADLAKGVVAIEGIQPLPTSAVTGSGIDELRAEILKSISGAEPGEHETGFLTNLRHQRLVEESLLALDAADRAVKERIPHEMVMIDLYNALKPLDAITGETTADDILNLIFSSFCIGK
jgi:tRNA modification GTPase